MWLNHAVHILRKSLVALICGGILYGIWLAAFLLIPVPYGFAFHLALWLAAPVVTALGFAIGAALVERRTEESSARFSAIYLWALIGCSAGAAAIYPFGPMLIVFGMIFAGTLSVMIRQIVRCRRSGTG